MGKALAPDLVERFIQEYRRDLNATRAYLAIKPKTNPHSAGTLGARLLGRVGVQERLATLTRETLGRLEVSAESVLQELAVCGFSDFKDYIQNGGDLDLSETAHPLATRAVSSVKHKTRTYGPDERSITEHEFEYKLHPKVQSLRTLLEHLTVGLGGGREGFDRLPPGGRELRVRWVKE
jgi:hypothetical protein